MNGRWPSDAIDAPGIGVAYNSTRLEAAFTPTLDDPKVTVEPTYTNCLVKWNACDKADRYRFDLYVIDNLGPAMRTPLRHVMVQSTWTEATEIATIDLKPMTTYRCVVFAFKGEEFVGRYESPYCVIRHARVGEMLCDNTDDYAPETAQPLAQVSRQFTALPAEKSVLLNQNPDRGFRGEEIFLLPGEEKLAEWTEERVREHTRTLFKKSAHGQSVTVSRVYFNLYAYWDKPELPHALIDYIRTIYDEHRKMGVKMYLCHYYMRSPEENHPSTETVLSHLDQLKFLFEENKDVIYAMNFTFLGRYGEWSCIRVPIDRQAFVNAFMEAVPEDIYMITRQPRTKKTFVNPEYRRYPQIGFADDACHGLQLAHLDMGQGWNCPGSEWWDMAVRESPYAVNDSELFTTRWIRLSGTWPDGYGCMQSLSQKHMCTLSVEHGYYDVERFGGELEQTCLAGWMGQEVTVDTLKEFGLASSPSWFTDGNGNTVQRNAFEYIRDHLGYRFSAEELTVTPDGDAVNVSLNLKNYGYAAGFNLKSGFALLDETGAVVAETSAGDPAVWYGTNPQPYEDRALLTHTVSASLPLPEKAGTYRLAFYLKNALGQCARMDNALPYQNGYHILHTFVSQSR